MQDIRERGRDKGEKLKVLIVTKKNVVAGGMSGKEERESEARRRYGEE